MLYEKIIENREKGSAGLLAQKAREFVGNIKKNLHPLQSIMLISTLSAFLVLCGCSQLRLPLEPGLTDQQNFDTVTYGNNESNVPGIDVSAAVADPSPITSYSAAIDKLFYFSAAVTSAGAAKLVDADNGFSDAMFKNGSAYYFDTWIGDQLLSGTATPLNLVTDPAHAAVEFFAGSPITIAGYDSTTLLNGIQSTSGSLSLNASGDLVLNPGTLTDLPTGTDKIFYVDGADNMTMVNVASPIIPSNVTGKRLAVMIGNSLYQVFKGGDTKEVFNGLGVTTSISKSFDKLTYRLSISPDNKGGYSTSSFHTHNFGTRKLWIQYTSNITVTGGTSSSDQSVASKTWKVITIPDTNTDITIDLQNGTIVKMYFENSGGAAVPVAGNITANTVPGSTSLPAWEFKDGNYIERTSSTSPTKSFAVTYYVNGAQRTASVTGNLQSANQGDAPYYLLPLSSISTKLKENGYKGNSFTIRIGGQDVPGNY